MNLCVAVPLFFIFQFIHAQPDDLGFISIDCGIPVYSTHQDPVTSILYVSDYGFIGTGENRNISSDYINPSLAKGYFNLRFFPHGPRNCYTLRSLVTGNRYLVRASFYYGNYDGLGKPPIFDLYLGANYWHEVNFDARSVNWMDIIVVSPTDYLQVCLVNKGRGTPFISALELRSLNTTLYPPVNASQSLVLISSNRFLLGPTGKSIIRYPSDHHDRIWSTYDAVPNWTEISTTYVIQNNLSGVYDVPSSVIQNAATVNSSRMDFSWDPSDTSVDISSKYFFVFYLAELQNVPRNAVRQFDIIINNKTWNTQPYTPTYLFANYFSGIVDGMSNFRVSLVSTKNATLPPILNAMEMYLVKPITEVATDSGDAKAMMAIQENFGVIKNWMGDPCNPKAFVWRGLKCSYSAVDPSKITALNLSSFGLVGAISANLRDLKALQYLDLSHNNLSGPIPDFLGELSLLIFLDLSSNDLRGPIPDILLKKSDNGSLSISIDCGVPVNSSYQDRTSSITYVSDYGFITSGENHKISSDYIKPSLAKRNFDLRFFQHGARNCYTLRFLVAGNKYFVRALFYYGNYDGLNKPPVFDLYMGANYWHEVNISDAAAVSWMDIIVVAPADYLHVCLVNKGMGTPFISGLDLRPLRTTLYPEVNASQSLVLISSNRFNLGPTDNSIIRYPSDPHDRLWSTYDSIPNWNEVSTTSVVQNYLNDVYDVPSAVMQNAATVNGSRIDFSWGPSVNISSSYFFVFYFSELQNVQSNALRQFDIIINNKTWNMQPYSPPFLFTDSFSGVVQGLASYSVSLVATKNATLPPILNAMEMYLVEPITEVATDPGDARAMMAIQEKFGVKNNWMGDPCAPKAFAWGALNCSYSPVYPSRITALNLSSFGLAGAISTDFGNLNTLQYLDLSHNNLSGTIPDFLGQLPLLIFLDLSSNDLHGVIPYSLLQKSQSGILSLRVGNNANLCADGNACGSGRKKINGALVAAIIIPVIAVISLCILLFLLLRQKIKGKAMTKATGPENESALLENREFSYRELKHITSNFSQEIGKGGFGAVYFGYLENGNPVAVKVHSDSSSQGVKEFLAEAKHLTRIHHKNLVSLIGYCKEKNHLALVYEYMPEGNLQDHLRGSNSKPLTWEQRLHIACDSAQGLEYLHTACTPALIHRDVKSSNILLTAGLGAKVADFGLTKAFGDSKTHITTEPAGTMGYLDPEYFRSYHISEKSDVYSFGVVLLELITGRPPVVPISDSVSIHVGEWVNQSLDHGTIESIVDAKMGGDYDINSVWKVADLALHCKQEVSRERPTMAEVAAQLKECLDLENRRDGRRSLGSLEVDLQGGEIQAVAAGPTLR